MKKDGNSKAFTVRRAVCLKAVLIGTAVAFALLLLFAAGMTALETGFGTAALFATLSVAAGDFAAAFSLAKDSRKNGWLSGLIVGGVTFAVLTAVALALHGGGVTVTTVFRFVILMLSSLIGGILGVGKADARKYL